MCRELENILPIDISSSTCSKGLRLSLHIKQKVAPLSKRSAIKLSDAENITRRYRKLQNQSDIRGISLSGVPGETVSLGPDEVFCIGTAFSRWLREKSNQDGLIKISVGRDCRLSGPELSTALMGGMTCEGSVKVIDVGECTTPAMFKSCITPGHMYDGAVMITASHLPMNRNGLKFFTKDGGLDNKSISEIVTIAGKVRIQHGEKLKVHGPDENMMERVDFLPIYQGLLEKTIRDGVGLVGDAYWTPLKGFKIIVNAGNGMGGFIQGLLAKLGADTTGSLHLNPDGTFPNHLANPELPEAMDPTKKAVLANHADLGIVLDTDVDRAGVVDHNGLIINRNKLIAVMASIVLRDHPCTHIVTDSTTSDGLHRFIQNAGGHHVRYQKGYKNVIDKALELNRNGIDCQMAIETSGHGALKENDMLDDGAYMAMKILIEMARRGQGKSISDLVRNLEEPKDRAEFRLQVIDTGVDTLSIFNQVLEAFKQALLRVDGWEIDEPNYEGLRINVKDPAVGPGWVLLRMSLHDPIIIFNVESEVEDGVAAIANTIVNELLLPFRESLDLTQMRERIEKSSAQRSKM